nr:formin-like protein 5 [Equus caballus]
MEPHARTLPGLKPITWGGPGASEERQGRDVSATSRASASPAAERRPPLPPPPLLPHTERRRPQPPETSRSALATLPSAARAPSLTGTAAELGRQSRPPAPAPTSELRALVGWRARHSRPPRSPRPLPRRPRPAICFLRGQSGGLAPPPPGPRSGVSVAARLGLGKENGRGVALGGEGLHPNPLGFRPCPAHTPRPRWQPCQASPAQPQWPRSPRWIGTRVGRRPKERMRDAGGHRVTVAQISSLTCLPRHGMRSRSPPLPEGHLRTDPRRLTATPRTSQEVGASLGIMERAE